MRLVYRPDHPEANANGMVDLEIAGPKHASDQATYVITDEIAPTRHMADGNYYTSKAKMRETNRAHSCIEVGNEISTLLKPRKPVQMSREQRRNEIRRAISQLR